MQVDEESSDSSEEEVCRLRSTFNSLPHSVASIGRRILLPRIAGVA